MEIKILKGNGVVIAHGSAEGWIPNPAWTKDSPRTDRFIKVTRKINLVLVVAEIIQEMGARAIATKTGVSTFKNGTMKATVIKGHN